jgi:hypothetical protein
MKSPGRFAFDRGSVRKLQGVMRTLRAYSSRKNQLESNESVDEASAPPPEKCCRGGFLKMTQHQ